MRRSNPFLPAPACNHLEVFWELLDLVAQGTRYGGFHELDIQRKLRSLADEVDEPSAFELELFGLRRDLWVPSQVGLRFLNALSYLFARGVESFEESDQLRDCFDNTIRGVIARADRFEQLRLRLGLEGASKLLTTLFEPRLIVRRRLAGDREAACELVAMSLEIIERRLNRVGLFGRLAERSLERRDITLKVFFVRHRNQKRFYSNTQSTCFRTLALQRKRAGVRPMRRIGPTTARLINHTPASGRSGQCPIRAHTPGNRPTEESGVRSCRSGVLPAQRHFPARRGRPRQSG